MPWNTTCPSVPWKVGLTSAGPRLCLVLVLALAACTEDQSEEAGDSGVANEQGEGQGEGPGEVQDVGAGGPPDVDDSPPPPGPVCGDGVVHPTEECDDGADNDNELPDHCRTDCRLPSCGDGVTDEQDECDSGRYNSDERPDHCRSDCRLPRCGDGVIDEPEECDEGLDNGAPAPNGCRGDCSAPWCGDGFVDDQPPWNEICDDGLMTGAGPSPCGEDCTPLTLCAGVQRWIDLGCAPFPTVHVSDDASSPSAPLYPAAEGLFVEQPLSLDCLDNADEYVIEVSVGGCAEGESICVHVELDTTIGSSSSNLVLWLVRGASDPDAEGDECYFPLGDDPEDSILACDGNLLAGDVKEITVDLGEGRFFILVGADDAERFDEPTLFNLNVSTSDRCD